MAVATPPTVPAPLSFHEERTLVAPWPVHDPTVVDSPAAPPGPEARAKGTAALVTIGEFARSSRLSAKALRRYD
ncbi:hypothetical protein ABZV54_44510, partial [Streptomyces sp. NPDC005096]